MAINTCTLSDAIFCTDVIVDDNNERSAATEAASVTRASVSVAAARKLLQKRQAWPYPEQSEVHGFILYARRYRGPNSVEP